MTDRPAEGESRESDEVEVTPEMIEAGEQLLEGTEMLSDERRAFVSRLLHAAMKAR
jgi:hypothetical protein